MGRDGDEVAETLKRVNGHADVTYADLNPGTFGNEEHEGNGEVATARDKTVLPNWLMPVLCFLLFSLLGFVYTTMQSKIDDLKELRKEDAMEVRIWRTYVINLTIEMKAKGMNPPPLPDTK